MKDNQAFKEKVHKLASINDVSKLKLEICSILTVVIISKDFFKYTKDIYPFLKSLDIEFRDYVFKNRMLLLGKLLKHIMDQELKEQIVFYQKTIYEVIREYYNQANKIADSVNEDSDEDKKSGNNKKRNYMMELLQKYSRNKDRNAK